METEELPRAQSDRSNDLPLSSAGETRGTDEPILTTKRELRKILREDSNWSPRSILITALTGVSAALISTQLTGIVSSVVLIGIMAFITASISEIYRVFLALTGLGARKAAARAAKVLPLVPVPQGGVSPEEAVRPITEAIEAVTGPYHLDELQEAEHPGIFRRMGYHIRNYGKANPFLWLVVLFFGIAATTLSVTYLVTDGEPPRIINRTVVTQQELSSSDRASIVAEAKKQALAELQKEQKTVPTAAPTTTVTEVPQSLSDELTSMGSQLTAMEKQLNELKADQPETSPSSTPQPPGTDQQALLKRIGNLEAERDELTERLSELEAKVSADEAARDSTQGSQTVQ